ncbi:ADP-ribosylglycohydrolase [Coniochaeta ligniaria NRRL 30616]|uniref:ADP-ribosylglycohydrolase n=1 Tax=Coniochaeta ligniaria NRRL 30616 TaxID=1408157 RepID=A0A1J7JTS6_9PEZI|nr:ADP-ribosylglycohydrolase [Coniochaeta ligniaria NRRL 30616]
MTPHSKFAELSSANALVRAALHDRTIGALVGSALGDAIGLYTEFLSAPLAAAAYPSRSFTFLPTPTPFKLDTHRCPKTPGDWTDDTDHALLLLLSHLHTARTTNEDNQDDDPPPLPTQKQFASRLRVWVQQGLRALDTMPLGLGRLVGTVVATKGFEDDPEAVSTPYWVRTGRRIAPNGSLMRTHPLGLMCLWRGEEEAFAVAASISRVTHVDPRCVVACVIGTGLVRGVVRGEVSREEDIDGLVARAVVWFERDLEQRGRLTGTAEEACGKDEVEDAAAYKLDMSELEKHVNAEVLDVLQLDDPPAIGYVYKTLGSGIVLLRQAMRKMAARDNRSLVEETVFEELITDLIMRGGDADTNACFAGVLLGAYLGYKVLPGHWKHGLRQEKWLIGKAEALCRVLGLADGGYDGQMDEDTREDGGRGFISQQEMEGRWMVLQQSSFKKMQDASDAAVKPASRWSVPWHGKGKRN